MGVLAGPFLVAGAMFSGMLCLAGWAPLNAFGTTALLCLVSIMSGAGVVMLQGWCSGGRVVASAGLLAACGMGVFLLSCPTFLGLVKSQGPFAPNSLVGVIAESGSFIGILVAVVMTPVIIIEVLLRWAMRTPSDGCEGIFILVRLIVSLLIVSVGLNLIRDEGVARLVSVLERMRS